MDQQVQREIIYSLETRRSSTTQYVGSKSKSVEMRILNIYIVNERRKCVEV